jgi:type II secretory ATPase GspE/PulE/Tfp pilus assembly ATPase PilB-like protein
MEATAIKEGMLTMQADGLIKALRGETTIEEILRVTSEA